MNELDYVVDFAEQYGTGFVYVSSYSKYNDTVQLSATIEGVSVQIIAVLDLEKYGGLLVVVAEDDEIKTLREVASDAVDCVGVVVYMP